MYGTSLYHVEWSAEEQAILEARRRAARQETQQPEKTLFHVRRAALLTRPRAPPQSML